MAKAQTFMAKWFVIFPYRLALLTLFYEPLKSHKSSDRVIDVIEFMEPVVPAYRVAEVAKVLES